MFNNQNFSAEVLGANQLVLVDFFATWCGPCQAQAPIIEDLSKEYEGKVKIGKLDIEHDLAVAQKYNVMSVPTLIFFKAGQEVKKLVGLQSKEELRKEIDGLLKQENKKQDQNKKDEIKDETKKENS
jgi:thioredoxin 1